MRAIAIEGSGKDARLVVGDAARPELRAGELRIAVAATAVNRADLMQRRGLYPPPPGASPILGLECAGEIAELGSALRTQSAWQPGDRVMALLAGGGYAEQVAVDAGPAATHQLGEADQHERRRRDGQPGGGEALRLALRDARGSGARDGQSGAAPARAPGGISAAMAAAAAVSAL